MTRNDDDSVISFRSSSTSSPTVVVHSTTSGTSEQTRRYIPFWFLPSSSSTACPANCAARASPLFSAVPVRVSSQALSTTGDPTRRLYEKDRGIEKLFNNAGLISVSLSTRQIARKTIKSKSELLAKPKHPHPPVHPLPLLAVLSFLPSGGW